MKKVVPKLASKSPLSILLQSWIEEKNKFDKNLSQTAGKPCKPQQIKSLEKRLGKPLPRAYREFLEIHNGWGDAGGGYEYRDFLAIEDHDLQWVKNRVSVLSGYLDEAQKDDSKIKNPFKEGAIPIRLGEDAHVYIVLNPKKSRKGGDMDFIEFDLSTEQDRYKTFEEILRSDISAYKSLNKRGRKK